MDERRGKRRPDERPDRRNVKPAQQQDPRRRNQELRRRKEMEMRRRIRSASWFFFCSYLSWLSRQESYYGSDMARRRKRLIKMSILVLMPPTRWG